jgi:hypothetical protein
VPLASKHTDLSVDDRVLHGQLTKDGAEGGKPQVILVAGDQFTFTILDVRKRTEAVVLQFEDVVRMVEWILYQTEPHRVKAW